MKLARRLGRWTVRVLLLLIILAQVLYLVRRPLVEGPLMGYLEEALGEALGAEIRIGEVRGNWVTGLQVGPLDISAANGQYAIEKAQIRIAMAPWKFLGGDFAGLERMQIAAHAARLDLGVTAPGEEVPPDEDASELDLRGFAALLPEGAVVEVDQLTVQGAARAVSGRVRVTVPARTEADAPLVATIEAPHIDARVTLTQAGGVSAEVDSPAPASWFEVLTGADGERLHELSVAGELAGSEVRGVRVHLRAHGLRVEGSDLRCDLTEPLASLRGGLELEIEDPKALADLVPEAAGFEPELRAALQVNERELEARVAGTVRSGDTSAWVQLDVDGSGASFLDQLELRALVDTTDAGIAVEGKLIREGETTRIEELLARTDGVELAVSGVMAAEGPAGWADALMRDSTLDVELRQVDLGRVLGQAGIPDVTGELRGGLAWRADGSASLAGALEGEMEGLGSSHPTTLSLGLRADAEGIVLSDLEVLHGDGSARGSASVAVALGDLLEGTADLLAAPLDVALDLDGFNLQALQAAALGLSDLGGDVRGQLRVGGVVAEPKPTLDLRLADVYLRPQGGSRLTGVSGELRVTPAEVAIEALRGEIGAGPFELSGSFRAPGSLMESWREGQADLRLVGDNLLIHRRDGLRVRGDLELDVTGPIDDLVARGALALHSSKMVGRIPFVTVGQTGGAAAREGIVLEGPDLGPEVGVRLDVDITTREPIAVKTNLFRGDITTSLKVTGPLSAPVLEGTLSGSDAEVRLPGCRFSTPTLLVRFERSDPRFPTLDVIGYGRRHGFDLQMVVRGRYDQPEVLLSSTPPLPGDELTVLVATGARPQTLRQRGARGAATMLGAYAAEELADYLFGSESTEAKESFIERFSLETGTEISAQGTESIVVEFRTYEQLYLQGERDVYEDINFGVVYRIKFK